MILNCVHLELGSIDFLQYWNKHLGFTKYLSYNSQNLYIKNLIKQPLLHLNVS